MVNVRVGVSGWSFEAWKDGLYAGIPRARWLQHFSSEYDTVEINYTFRRTLAASTAEKWRNQVPADFRFSIKAHQRITHSSRLSDPAETLPYFVDSVRNLGDRLGPLLFQLPPNFARDDDRLQEFLDALPPDLEPVFEFRHESWLVDDVYEMLKSKGAGLVIAETDERRIDDVVTGSVVYLRLRKDEYTDRELEAWAERLPAYEARSVWAYFKHEDRAPEYASRLVKLMGGD